MNAFRVRVVLSVAAICFAAASGFAQTSFYTDLLHRGVSDYEQTQYVKSIRELRLAAFGLLEDIPAYQTAQIYIALASSKSNQLPEARAAAQKLIAAEKITPSYATLPIDASARREFSELLPKITTNEDLLSAPSMASQVLRGAKSWKDVIDLYSDIRTRRRLTNEETATLFAALVESGRIADAAGMRPLLPPAVAGASALAAQLTRVPAPPPMTQPAMAPASGGLPAAEITNQLREASKALAEARFTAARQIYLKLSQQLSSRRDLNLEIARGLHRVSALRESSAVYQRFYPLQAGEEIHMLAEAVNHYELGDVPNARKLLEHAIRGVTSSAELSFYRPRIERGS